MRSLFFSIDGYGPLTELIRDAVDGETGELERRSFPDGEHYQRVVTPVAGREVVIVGGTFSDAATLCLYDLACAVVKHGAQRLTLVVPYFGYSTMERAVHPGEVVTAKTRARLFSAVPQASGGNRVLLLDLHSEGIPHYFEGGITAIHLSGRELLCEAIREEGGADFVLGSTDTGRAKWVEALANRLGVDAAIILKRRISGSETQVVAVSAEVSGRSVVIYDDMVRTGGSLIGAARTFRDAGATRVVAVCTHGVFPPGAFARLEASGLFARVVATDSHPNAVALADAGLRVVSVANVFAARLGG